ncbi:MAG: hypothetical protein ACOZBL_01805 [Patescibacteria group bacterium]
MANLYIIFSINSFTTFGSAFHPEDFITCQTKNPIAFIFQDFKSAKAFGLSSRTFLTIDSISELSTGLNPLSSTILAASFQFSNISMITIFA